MVYLSRHDAKRLGTIGSIVAPLSWSEVCNAKISCVINLLHLYPWYYRHLLRWDRCVILDSDYIHVIMIHFPHYSTFFPSVLPRLFDGDRERGHPLRYKLDAYDGLFYCWTLLSTIGGGDLVFRPKHITDTLAFFICILVGIPVCVLFILSLHRLTRWRIASMLQVRLPTLRSISFFSSSTAAEDFEEQCLAPKRRANLWSELQDEDGDNIKSVSNDLDLNEDIMDIKLEYSKRNMSATKRIAKESRYESSMAKWNKQISMSALQKKNGD